jgi:hypothetical protein
VAVLLDAKIALVEAVAWAWWWWSTEEDGGCEDGGCGCSCLRPPAPVGGPSGGAGTIDTTALDADGCCCESRGDAWSGLRALPGGGCGTRLASDVLLAPGLRHVVGATGFCIILGK